MRILKSKQTEAPKLNRERDQTCGYQGGIWVVGELEEGGQKVPTNISRDVMCNMITVVNAAVQYIGILLRE